MEITNINEQLYNCNIFLRFFNYFPLVFLDFRIFCATSVQFLYNIRSFFEIRVRNRPDLVTALNP